MDPPPHRVEPLEDEKEFQVISDSDHGKCIPPAPPRLILHGAISHCTADVLDVSTRKRKASDSIDTNDSKKAKEDTSDI